MVNQKGEFPRDAKVSARVRSSTKRLLKQLKQKGHHESDVIEYAAKQLADEPILLEWEIGELDIQIADINKIQAELVARRQAKLNRLRCIAPKRIDEDTMRTMLLNAAKEIAKDIVDAHGDNSLVMIEKRKNSIKVTAKDLGFPPFEFFDEVKKQVEMLCQTAVSDS